MNTVLTDKKYRKWVIFGVAYAIITLALLILINLDALNAWLGSLFSILRPVVIGLVIAYFCNPIFRLFERNLFYKVRPVSLRRVLSLIFTYIVVFLIILFFFLLLIPQVVSSILSFLESYDSYVTSVIEGLNGFIATLNQTFASGGTNIPTLDPAEIKAAIAGFMNSIDGDTIMELLKMIDLRSVGLFLENLVWILTDIIFGFFISLYLLNSKERCYAHLMRLRRALFSDEINQRITHVCDTTNRSFGGFFRGKLLDSFIIAILVYIAISLYGIEYPLLLATIIGVTDIIPIIGPIIGVFPAGFIILLSQPEKLIPFIIIIILVQQLDGNIISPKILGENTGVSSLCVIIAIATMGTLWGFVGMIVGVPLFATVLELSDKFFDKRLKAKGQPSSEEAYITTPDPMAKHSKKAGRHKERGFKRYEKKMLRLKQEALADGGIGDLTRFERFQLDTYNLACKYNIFSEYSDESLALFAAEEAAIAATLDEEKDESDISEHTDDQKSQQ